MAYQLVEPQLKKSETWTIANFSQRFKISLLDDLSSFPRIQREILDAWSSARQTFLNPLLQVRAILRCSEENKLLLLANEIRSSIDKKSLLRVVGKIPIGDTGFGIYYIHVEDAFRPKFKGTADRVLKQHREIVEEALKKRAKSLDFSDSGLVFQLCRYKRSLGLVDPVNNAPIVIDADLFIKNLHQLADVSFTTHEDSNLQTSSTFEKMLRQSDILYVSDKATNEIMSALIVTPDDRFKFSGFRLAEVTGFTSPKYRRLGLSSKIRQELYRMIHRPKNLWEYDLFSRTILFFESVRETSFRISLESGATLASGASLEIDGNLGDCYAPIDGAKQEVGYMPMGLTYLQRVSMDNISFEKINKD